MDEQGADAASYWNFTFEHDSKQGFTSHEVKARLPATTDDAPNAHQYWTSSGSSPSRMNQHEYWGWGVTGIGNIVGQSLT